MADVVEFVLQARDQASAVFERLRQTATRTADRVKEKFNEIRYTPTWHGRVFGVPIPREMGDRIDEIRGRLASVGQTARGVWQSMGAAASIAGVSIGLTAAGVVAALIKMNTEYQRLRGQLRTFEGSQGAANAVLADLRELAVELPFELKSITAAWIELRAIGVAPTEKMLRDFSDIAAAMSVDIIDVVHGIRRAVAGEFDPLETATGATFRVVGDKIRASFRGATEEIGRDARSIIGYLERIAATNFAGAARDQADTLGMAFSNLNDAAFNLAVSIGDAGLSASVVQLTRNLTELTNEVERNQVAIQVSWDRTVGLTKAIVDLVLFVPRVVLGAIRTVTAVVAILVGTAALAVEDLVYGALESLGRLPGAVGRFFRAGADAVARQMQRTRDGILSVGKDAGDGARQFTGAFREIGESFQELGDSFTESHALMRQNQQELAAREAKQFRDARDHAMELQALEARKRGGQKLTADEEQKHAALRKTLQLEQNALVREYNELLRSGEDKDRRAMLMRLVQDIELAKQGKLGVPGGGGAKEEKKDPLLERAQKLAKLIPVERERSNALVELGKIERQTHAELETGNLKLEERAKRYERLNVIQAAYDAAFKQQLESLKLLTQTEGGQAEALDVLLFMERGLQRQVRDTTRSIDERREALKRLKDVESEVAQAREAAEAARQRREIYGDERERQDARDHDPTRAPKLPIDKTPAAPGPAFGRKELGLPTGKPALLEAEQAEKVLASVRGIIAQIGGRETVWTRMAAGIRRGRTEAEMLRDTIDDIANISIRGLGDAMLAAGEAIGSGSAAAGEAMLGAMLGAIAQVAKALGDMFTAQAIASFASITAPPPIGPNPGGAAAGTGYLAAAAAAYAISGLMSGVASRAGGGGGGGRGDSIRDVGTELRNAKQSQKVVVLEGDYYDLKDPRSIDRLAHTLGEAFDARVAVRRRRGSQRLARGR